MNVSFLDLIHLFSCGAHGIKPCGDRTYLLDEILAQAVSQGILPVVFLALQDLYDSGEIKMDPPLFEKLKMQIIAIIARNTSKLHMTQQLLKGFADKNIECCVLKGETLAALYHTPDSRISSDTDILIDPKRLDDAIAILNELQFTIEPHAPTSHHIRAVHKHMGLVELHFRLYDELYEEAWFDNQAFITEGYRALTTANGYQLPVLGITDGLIYVVLHYVKHFLTQGVGIRQLMDLLLYMQQYDKEIDWDRFNDLMIRLKYKKFIEISIGIGVKYLNFSEASLPDYTGAEDTMMKILTDMEQGGVFGKNTEDRHGFYLQYTKARFDSFKSETYQDYMKKWYRPNSSKLVFPSVKVLSLAYPYLNKRPYLYFAAWIHRLFATIIHVLKGKKTLSGIRNLENQAAENAVIQDRMNLIHELDMI